MNVPPAFGQIAEAGGKFYLFVAVTKTLIEGGFVTDPFRRINLTVEYVDAVSGSQKTLTAIRESVTRAARGTKTIMCMPTLELVREMAAFARALSEGLFAGSVPVVEITSTEGDELKRRGRSIPESIRRHIRGTHDKTGEPLADVPQGGHLLFITHEAAHRMGMDWPTESKSFEIIIDEEPKVLLTREPFRLRESFYNLTNFVEAVPTRKLTDTSENVFTDRDARTMEWCERMIDPANNASPEEMESAQRKLDELVAKRDNSTMRQAMLSAYLQVVPKLDKDPDTDNPMRFVEMRRDMGATDDIYRYFQPLPAWLTQGVACFTARGAWERMVGRMDKAPDRGQITISGFRRPDALRVFNRITIMSALFESTMCYDLWSRLGVNFVPSRLIDLNTKQTDLGMRRLRIYYMTEEGWSKRMRDRAGGISAIFNLIKQSGAVDLDEPVCVCTNKDDATEDNPQVVREHFPNAVMMPHNSRGQNRFREYHQLIHCAALNSYTPDIRWIETALGIDSPSQRIARTGHEVYQSLMRLSLREPSSDRDIAVVVMDRDVADWLVRWFKPAHQVEVIGIDTGGVLRKGKPGRPLIGETAMTAAERQRRRRALLRAAATEAIPES